MKRFFTNLWCLTLAGALATACSDDVAGTQAEMPVRVAETVSVDQALESLNTFLAYTSTRNPKQTPDAGSVLVFCDDAATRASESAGQAYIVNFEEGGYAVLGANTGQERVLAVVERGSMTPESLMADLKAVEAGKKVNTPVFVNAQLARYILSRPVGMAVEAPAQTRASGVELQDALLTTKWGPGMPVYAEPIVIGTAQILAYNAWKYNRCPQAINGKSRSWAPIIRMAQTPNFEGITSSEFEQMRDFIIDISSASIYIDFQGYSKISIGSIVDMLSVSGGYENITLAIINQLVDGSFIIHPEKIREMIFLKKRPVYYVCTIKPNGMEDYGCVWDGWMNMPMADGTVSISIHHNLCDNGTGDGWYALGAGFNLPQVITMY